jgi:hypothetical protein
MDPTDPNQEAAFERTAAAFANLLWGELSSEALAEMVDWAHEPGDDGEPEVFETLWDAVLSRCFTIVVAAQGKYIEILHGPPVDRHNAKGDR